MDTKGEKQMKSLLGLTDKDQNIIDTILMRCEREWVNITQLTKEFNLPNTHFLQGYLRLLRQEGYVFERQIRKQPQTLSSESWYRIVDFKEKKVKGEKQR